MSSSEDEDKAEFQPPARGVGSGAARQDWQGPSHLVHSAAMVFYRGLKRTYRRFFLADPKGFRKSLRRAESLVFHQKPGPPKKHDPNIAAAARKRRVGAPWPDLYPLCIPGYDRLTEYTKGLAEDGFRRKVNLYLKRHPRRNNRTA